MFVNISKFKGVGPKTLATIKECFSFKTRSIFSSECSGNFLDDFEFLSNNKEFIEIVSKQKNWRKDLKWFIDAHKEDHEYYKGNLTDNQSVIKQFISLKNGIYKDTEKLLKSLYLHNER